MGGRGGSRNTGTRGLTAGQRTEVRQRQESIARAVAVNARSGAISQGEALTAVRQATNDGSISITALTTSLTRAGLSRREASRLASLAVRRFGPGPLMQARFDRLSGTSIRNLLG